MKLHIEELLLKNRSASWHLATLATLTRVLGALVLILSLCFYFVYEWSGVSSWVSVEVVADLRSFLRCFAFIICPSLGVAFVAIASGIRQYGAKAGGASVR